MALSSVTDAVGRWAIPSGLAVLIVGYLIEGLRGKADRKTTRSTVSLGLMLIGVWMSDHWWGNVILVVAAILMVTDLVREVRQRRLAAPQTPASPTYTLHPITDVAELNQRTGGAALVRTLKEKDLVRLAFSAPMAERWIVAELSNGMYWVLCENPDKWLLAVRDTTQ
jgi:hypothetical protein